MHGFMKSYSNCVVPYISTVISVNHVNYFILEPQSCAEINIELPFAFYEICQLKINYIIILIQIKLVSQIMKKTECFFPFTFQINAVITKKQFSKYSTHQTTTFENFTELLIRNCLLVSIQGSINEISILNKVLLKRSF